MTLAVCSDRSGTKFLSESGPQPGRNCGNNYTKGNAGFLPSVTTTNRLEANLTSTTQNMNDGSQRTSSGIHNTTGSAALNLDMPLFRGFNIQTLGKS
jgi:hypothetical protein